MVGVQLEANFHIITGQTAAISNIKKCVNNARLAMTGLTLEPLASATSVLDDQEIEAGVALVDIGGGTTDVAIFKDGIIRHTAVILLEAILLHKTLRKAVLYWKIKQNY